MNSKINYQINIDELILRPLHLKHYKCMNFLTNKRIIMRVLFTVSLVNILPSSAFAIENISFSQMHTRSNTTLNNETAPQASNQNRKTITGIIVDETDQPIIGATVVEKGTTNGVITGVNGNFSLDVPIGVTVTISYMGYLPQDIQVGSKDVINISLEEDLKILDEVVVIGYGVQRKENLTGSVGTVNVGESLKSRPVTNVQELLAGSVSGVSVNKASGAVGSGASINIRGTSTIGTSSGALVLIDGIPGNMHTLNPNDVETISILKDAASASIYGSRAANGVILVTTKKGSFSTKPTVELSTNIGIQNPMFKLDFVGSEDYMKLYDQALINDGKGEFYGAQGIKDLKAGKYPDNKWYEEIYKRNTIVNNTHVAISGRNETMTYRMAVSNDYQDGTLPNNNYNRLVFKPDMEFKILDNLTARVNMQYTQTNIKEPSGGTTIAQTMATRISPITPIKEANGLYGVGSAVYGNPIAGVNESGYKELQYKEMLAMFDINYQPLKNWDINAKASTFTFNSNYKDRANTFYLYDAEGEIAKINNPVSFLRQDNAQNSRTQLQVTSNYDYSINSAHNFNILAGYSQELYQEENFWASRDNLPFQNIDVLDLGSSNKQNGGGAQEVAIQSAFARLNYNYKNTYLLEANVRMDGSSRFAEGNRWGAFPSFSAGWNIHKEAFLENTSWISELKLRGSWGLLGDSEKEDIGYYPTATVIKYDPKIYSFNNALVGGAYTNRSVNQDITWEVSRMANIAIDLGMFNQKVKLTIEYFDNLRSDILYIPPVPLEFGLNAPITNLLKMENKGMDFLLSYNDSKGDFTWGIGLTASYSKNKVLEMGDNDRWVEGNTITYLNNRYQLAYGYESDGLFQSQEDVDQHATQGAAAPGNIKFKDQNGDNKIDGDDRVVLNKKIPVNYGINLNFGYRNFDMSMNMYGVLNKMRYISNYEGWAFFLTQNARPMHLDSWTPENTDATYPKLTISNTSNDTQYNDYWLRKANFLKIQNVQVGYTLPQRALDKIRIQYLRLYVSGQNLGTVTGYDGFDPEGGYYPIPRTFAFGLNIKF